MKFHFLVLSLLSVLLVLNGRADDEETGDGSEKFVQIVLNSDQGKAARFWELKNSNPDRGVRVVYRVTFQNPSWRPTKKTVELAPDSVKFLGYYRLDAPTFQIVKTEFLPIEPSPTPEEDGPNPTAP